MKKAVAVTKPVELIWSVGRRIYLETSANEKVWKQAGYLAAHPAVTQFQYN